MYHTPYTLLRVQNVAYVDNVHAQFSSVCFVVLVYAAPDVKSTSSLTRLPPSVPTTEIVTSSHRKNKTQKYTNSRVCCRLVIVIQVIHMYTES
jgi:hypothetical protein